MANTTKSKQQRGERTKTRREAIVNVYLTEEEKALLEEKAERAGLATATYVRSLVLKDLRALEPQRA